MVMWLWTFCVLSLGMGSVSRGSGNGFLCWAMLMLPSTSFFLRGKAQLLYICHAAQQICLVPTAYAHDKPEVATSVGAGFSVWTRMHGKNDESSKVGQLPWM